MLLPSTRIFPSGTLRRWRACILVRPLLLFSVVLSLEFLSTHCFFMFSRFYFWILSRHRHPPTAFAYAPFNQDISNWNTAAVTNMYLSTFIPPVSVVLSLKFHSLPLPFLLPFPSFFQQWLQTNVVRRCLVVFDGFQQCIWISWTQYCRVRLLRRGHVHGISRIAPLFLLCLSNLSGRYNNGGY